MKEYIDDKTMEYVGVLAQLELSEEEKQQAKGDMESMLRYMDQMNQLDTNGIEPMSHFFSTSNCFREDVVTNENNADQVLKNSPVTKEGQYVVPMTISGKKEER